jgi:hypothetical protein
MTNYAEVAREIVMLIDQNIRMLADFMQYMTKRVICIHITPQAFLLIYCLVGHVIL